MAVIVTKSCQLIVESLFLCLTICGILLSDEVIYRLFPEPIFYSVNILHGNLVRNFLVAGKILLDLVCCMNLLSESFMQQPLIFHVFQNLCACFDQHASTPCIFN